MSSTEKRIERLEERIGKLEENVAFVKNLLTHIHTQFQKLKDEVDRRE